ncbi:MAG: PKD domain-containing protein [Flavobacterium sp.]|uniref:PKD domain-containing protein n=1 Tax=Flavobacterium sp. TaxID=239 RepID=UPI003BCA5ABC
MKNCIKGVSMLFIIAMFFGCSKDDPSSTSAPTVDFSYSGANNPAPSTVSFTSTTTNATNYLWDFGDNGSSTSANPQHLYTTGGVYTVRLTVTGAGGTTSISKTVNIGASLTNVKISKVTIVNIPFTKLGGTSGWDLDGTGPDVFFQIQDQNSTVLFDVTSANRLNNVTPSILPFFWTLTNPFVITNLTQSRFIQLFDYDLGTPNEDMGYVGFLMSNYTTGSSAYPSSVTETNSTYGITVKLDLIWY